MIAEALRLLDERDQLQNRPVSAKDYLMCFEGTGLSECGKIVPISETAPISPAAYELMRNGVAMTHKCACSTPM